MSLQLPWSSVLSCWENQIHWCGREQGGGFPPLHGLLPSPWALSTHTRVLNANYAQLLKMQEMSLLFQKENEPEQEKNQQAPASVGADSVVGRTAPPLAASREACPPAWWGAGTSALEAFPVLMERK